MELVRRAFFSKSSVDCRPGTLAYVCNVCGASNQLDATSFQREGSACGVCGAVMRFRSLMCVLVERLFGAPLPLTALSPQKQLCGIGMSDAPAYARRLEELFDYTNTFFHTHPRLDITSIDNSSLERYDFVITSDVFEHVAPPVQCAFDNLFRILKPGGWAVFSVPFSLDDETKEHYPQLHDFTVSQGPDGRWRLSNVTADGRHQDYENLVFHGGPGSTLEMRLFSLSALQRHFLRAGFEDFHVHGESRFAFGIHWSEPWSITISARRPL